MNLLIERFKIRFNYMILKQHLTQMDNQIQLVSGLIKNHFQEVVVDLILETYLYIIQKIMNF